MCAVVIIIVTGNSVHCSRLTVLEIGCFTFTRFDNCRIMFSVPPAAAVPILSRSYNL